MGQNKLVQAFFQTDTDNSDRTAMMHAQRCCLTSGMLLSYSKVKVYDTKIYQSLFQAVAVVYTFGTQA